MKRILFASAIALFAGVSTVVATVPDNPDYPGLMRDIMMLEEQNLRPLLATAEASEAAFMRENFCAALGALGALENQLESRGSDDPNLRLVIGDIDRIRAILIDNPNTNPACIDNPNT
jgi:hypothetical protein